MLFARVDWLVRKLITSTIHLRAAVETKLRVKSFVQTIFRDVERNNFLVFAWYILK